MPLRFRRALQAAVFLPLLAWLAVSFYVELDKTWRRSRRVLEPQARRPALWEIESTDMHRLAYALAWADERVPPGRPLAFTSAGGRQEQSRYRYSWAAYLLPERDVIPFPSHPEAFRGEYLLAYGVRPERPDLRAADKKKVAEHGDAVLYRLASGGPLEAEGAPGKVPGEGSGDAHEAAPGTDGAP